MGGRIPFHPMINIGRCESMSSILPVGIHFSDCQIGGLLSKPTLNPVIRLNSRTVTF